MLKKYSLNRLLILFTAIGFAFLLLDTTIEHWDLLKAEIMVYIPLVFSLIGLVISSIAFFVWKDKIIRYLQIFLFISFIVAGTGVYFHVAEEEDEINLTIEERQHEEKEKDKPLMAPIAFAGLVVVGLLGTMRKWDAEVLKS